MIWRGAWGAGGRLGLLALALCGACAGPQARPQVGVERTGEAFAPLPPRAKVKLYFRGEPQRSYREIGVITSTCPWLHWVRGQHVKGRPVCVDGLRQGARKLGAQAVVEIRTRKMRPSWQPDQPWLIMKGMGVRLGR